MKSLSSASYPTIAWSVMVDVLLTVLFNLQKLKSMKEIDLFTEIVKGMEISEEEFMSKRGTMITFEEWSDGLIKYFINPDDDESVLIEVKRMRNQNFEFLSRNEFLFVNYFVVKLEELSDEKIELIEAYV